MARKRRYHHGALEAALVDEAFAEVCASGAEQVSLRRVAQTVGVSASAAYQHFPDKAGLMAAVCDRGFDVLADRMRTALEAVDLPGAAGALARFAALGRTYVEFAAAQPHLFRHMFGGDRSATGDDAHDGPHEMSRTEASAAAVPAPVTPDDDAYVLLVHAITDLHDHGLLREGVGLAQGLDVLSWSLVHGFAALVVDGKLPPQAGPVLLALQSRLILSEDAARRVDLTTVLDAVARGR